MYILECVLNTETIFDGTALLFGIKSMLWYAMVASYNNYTTRYRFTGIDAVTTFC